MTKNCTKSLKKISVYAIELWETFKVSGEDLSEA